MNFTVEGDQLRVQMGEIVEYFTYEGALSLHIDLQAAIRRVLEGRWQREQEEWEAFLQDLRTSGTALLMADRYPLAWYLTREGFFRLQAGGAPTRAVDWNRLPMARPEQRILLQESRGRVAHIFYGGGMCHCGHAPFHAVPVEEEGARICKSCERQWARRAGR